MIKHAFKMGFCFRLAESGVSASWLQAKLASTRFLREGLRPQDVQRVLARLRRSRESRGMNLIAPGLDRTEVRARLGRGVPEYKLAKDKDEKAPPTHPTTGFGADALKSGIKPLAIGLSGGLGASLVIPQSAGRVLGGMLADGVASQMDTTDELRTRYLIKRYRDFIEERRALMDNRLVSEALRG